MISDKIETTSRLKLFIYIYIYIQNPRIKFTVNEVKNNLKA